MRNILDYYSIDPTSFRYISHHGILGQKWGVRRYQNKDGSLTKVGKDRLESEKSNKFHAREKKIGSGSGYADKWFELYDYMDWMHDKPGFTVKPLSGKAYNERWKPSPGFNGNWSNAIGDMRKNGLQYTNGADPYSDLENVYTYYLGVIEMEEYLAGADNGLTMLNRKLDKSMEEMQKHPGDQYFIDKYEKALKEYKDAVKKSHETFNKNKRVADAHALLERSVQNVRKDSNWQERIKKEMSRLNEKTESQLIESGNNLINDHKTASTQFFAWNEEWDKYN